MNNKLYKYVLIFITEHEKVNTLSRFYRMYINANKLEANFLTLFNTWKSKEKKK